MTLYMFCNPRVAFPALEAGDALSGRVVSEISCVHSRCLFGEGLRSPRVFDWDDSIAYDRSFA